MPETKPSTTYLRYLTLIRIEGHSWSFFWGRNTWDCVERVNQEKQKDTGIYPGSLCCCWVQLWGQISVCDPRWCPVGNATGERLKNSLGTASKGLLGSRPSTDWLSCSNRTLYVPVNKWNDSTAHGQPFFLLSGLTFKRMKIKLTFQGKTTIGEQGKIVYRCLFSEHGAWSNPQSCCISPAELYSWQRVGNLWF